MNKRKTTSIALAAAVTISTVQLAYPANVFAHENTNVIENDEKVPATADNNLSGNCGATENDTVTWELIKNNSDNSNPTYTLTISGSGTMMDMVTKANQSNTQPWINYNGSITKIVVNEGVKALGSTVFRNLKECTEINLPTSLIKIGNSALTSMNKLSTINLASGNTSFLVDDNVLYTKGYETLVKYPQMKSLENYTVNSACKKIGTEAFHGVQQLKTVTLPDGLKEIGSWSMSSMTNLTEIKIPNSVTSILSCAFNGNKAMTTLTFEKNSSLETIASGSFYASGLIGELVIPASVKTIGEKESTYGAFSTILGLTKVSFEAGSQCTFIGEKTFNGNVTENAKQQSALSEVIIPTSVEYIGKSAFMNNRNLKTVTILGNSKELEIDSHAFTKCSTNKTEITIGDKVETTYVNVKLDAFENVKITLHSILTAVGENAFKDSDLDGTVIVGKDGNEQISIGKFAFKGTSIDTLICKSDVSTFNTQALEGAKLKKLVIESSSIKVNQSWANTEYLTVIDMTKVENITDSESNVWFSSKPSPLVVYLNDNSVTSDKFKKNNVAKVYVNGGSVDITSSDNTLLATPKKDKYKFSGWYENNSFSGEVVTTPQANKDYYAKWEKAVASVDGVGYTDLQTAINNADGKTVTIEKDNIENGNIELSKALEITGKNNIIIDFNGVKLSKKASIKSTDNTNCLIKITNSTNITMNNATFVSPSGSNNVIDVLDNSIVKLSNVNVDASNVSDSAATVSDNSSLELSNVSFVNLPEKVESAVVTNGKLTLDGIVNATRKSSTGTEKAPVVKMVGGDSGVTIKENAKVNGTSNPSNGTADKVDIIVGAGASADKITNNNKTSGGGYYPSNPTYTHEKIEGLDRYETAAKIADKLGSYDNVVLVNAESSMSDGLSASGLAGKENGAILLTKKDSIPKATMDRLKKVKKVYIIGGENAISQKVYNEITKNVPNVKVERLGGKTRVETSELVAKKLGNYNKAFVVNGFKGEADAMSASAVAAKNGAPILLTNGKTSTHAKKAGVEYYVIGGDTVVDKSIATKYDAEVLAGKDRYATNKEVIDEFYSGRDKIYFANGETLVDALTASTLAKKDGIALVNVKSDKSVLKGKDTVQVGGMKFTIDFDK